MLSADYRRGEAADRIRIATRHIVEYRDRGWALTPTKGKAAYLEGWPELLLTVAELEAELRRGERGIGAILGEASGGLVDIDLDHEAAVELAPLFLPRTALVSGRPSRPRSHYWFVSTQARNLRFRSRQRGMLVELRSGPGAQTVVPPSWHSDGERMRWEAEGEPAAVEPRAIERAVAQLAVAADLRGAGWSAEEAAAFAHDPDPDRIVAWERRARRACPYVRWLGLRRPRQNGVAVIPGAITPGDTSSFTMAILAAVDVAGAAALFDVDLFEGQQLCPLHADGKPSFVTSGTAWTCNAGCGAGGPVHLVAAIAGMTYLEARDELGRRLGMTWRDFRAPGRSERGVNRRRREDLSTGVNHGC